MSERRSGFRLRHILAGLMVVAAISLLPIGFTRATHQANAATGVAMPQHAEHANTASPSILGRPARLGMPWVTRSGPSVVPTRTPTARTGR
jgi:hypothetical protein